jgi:hypothetical protein
VLLGVAARGKTVGLSAETSCLRNRRKIKHQAAER